MRKEKNLPVRLRVFRSEKRYGVMMHVGVQGFQIGREDLTLREARWYVKQANKALLNAGCAVEVTMSAGDRFVAPGWV